MKILVTGASGFVGKAIVSALLKLPKEKFYVYELVSRKSNYEKQAGTENIFRADITDYRDLVSVVNLIPVDVIIHSAGLAHQFGRQIREDFWRVNALGTENIAKLATVLKVKHLILMSSVAVYGTREANSKIAKSGNRQEDAEAGISENAVCRPKGFYAESKLEAEKIATDICEKNKIALSILRLATVIGEEDKGNVARLIKSIDRRRFVWIGGGENRKSLIYKGDVAGACLQILGKTGGTEIYNITGEAIRMRDIVAEIEAGLGKKTLPFAVSPKILDNFFLINSKLFGSKKINRLTETVNKWLSDEIYSGEKFKSRYNFQAATPIKEAIRREVESYKKPR